MLKKQNFYKLYSLIFNDSTQKIIFLRANINTDYANTFNVLRFNYNSVKFENNKYFFSLYSMKKLTMNELGRISPTEFKTIAKIPVIVILDIFGV